MENSYVVLRKIKDPGYPFGAFYCKDADDVDARLQSGDLEEGDIVIRIADMGEVVKQTPLKLQPVVEKM